MRVWRFLWAHLVIGTIALPSSAGPAYSYYALGDLKAQTRGETEPALLLLGGGDWATQALHWWVEKAGHGHIVILRASGTDDLQQDFYDGSGGISSVETLVFHDRKAASDSKVLAILRHADGIFIGGGDQSNYVRYWRGTPLNAALDRHVRSGKPIAGTSAGLAIMGAYSYGALDGDSLQSTRALPDPLGPGVTLVRDFLHLPYLANVITDSHFAERQRLGRLIVFVARLAHEEKNPAITGIGIDENAALCIDAHGIGHVVTDSDGSAWLVRPMRKPDLIEPGRPLIFLGVPVTGIGTQSTLDLKTFRVEKPAFHLSVDARGGSIETHRLPLRAGAP